MAQKHFHFADDKKRLAHDIYSQTIYLEELEQSISRKVVEMNTPTTSYKRVQLLAIEIKGLQLEAKKLETIIEDLQVQHDAIK